MNPIKKVAVVVASRANYGRSKTLIKAIDSHQDLQLELIVCGSAILDKYGKTSEIIKKDGLKISCECNYLLSGSDLRSQSTSTGLAIIQLTDVLAKIQPNFVVTIADRYETLATAISASYQNIPLIHLQGGDISGNIDDRVRHAITRLSDYHFPASINSYNNLIKMGESKNNIWMFGCPSMDIVYNSPSLEDLKRDIKLNHIFHDLIPKEYFLVLFHPVTDFPRESQNLMTIFFESLKEFEDKKIILISPNVDAGSENIRDQIKSLTPNLKNNLIVMENLAPEKFVTLIKNASICIGNSSSFLREAALCGTPSLILGRRQEGREMGLNCTLLKKVEKKSLTQAISEILEIRDFPTDNRFGDGSSGKKIAEQISKLPTTYKSKPKLTFENR